MKRRSKIARATEGPIEERLLAVLEAKFGFYFETVYRSPHAAELIDSKNRLSADLFAQSGRRYMKVLREMIEEATRAGELAPSRMELDADDLAEMLAAAAHGIESNATQPRAIPSAAEGDSAGDCGGAVGDARGSAGIRSGARVEDPRAACECKETTAA